jgi:hypothetical protein
MPAGQRLPTAAAWTIHSTAVRTRDGPERLDQAYRRLVSDTSRHEPPPAPDRPLGRACAASPPAFGR